MEREYKVLTIDEMSRVGEMGGIERYNRVVIKTRGGLIRTVDIEEKNFTEEKVKAILIKVATEADKILAG